MLWIQRERESLDRLAGEAALAIRQLPLDAELALLMILMAS